MAKREPSDLLIDETSEMTHSLRQTIYPTWGWARYIPYLTMDLSNLRRPRTSTPLYWCMQPSPLSFPNVFISSCAVRFEQSLKLSHLAHMDGLGIRFTHRFLRTWLCKE